MISRVREVMSRWREEVSRAREDVSRWREDLSRAREDVSRAWEAISRVREVCFLIDLLIMSELGVAFFYIRLLNLRREKILLCARL